MVHVECFYGEEWRNRRNVFQCITVRGAYWPINSKWHTFFKKIPSELHSFAHFQIISKKIYCFLSQVKDLFHFQAKNRHR